MVLQGVSQGAKMSLKSSPTRYGGVAITIHWLTAIAIFGMLASGLTADTMAADDPAKVTLLRGHVITGVLVGVLTLFRIVWWMAIDRRPQNAAGLSRVQALAAQVVHYGLYVVVLVMVASGLGTVALSGAGNQLFGGAPLPLPDFSKIPPFSVHSLMAWILILMLVGHIGAALWHQLVKRDRLLSRMGMGA
jgi:cytochrome b561